MTHLYFHLQKYGFFFVVLIAFSGNSKNYFLMMTGIVKSTDFPFTMRKRNTYETYM